jgi:CRP-like cAMP-binding protein
MPEDALDDVTQNRLLAALPEDVYARLRPNLERVPLALGKVIYEVNEPLSHVYFPVTAIVSLLYIMENGTSAEIGIVGCDGVVGIAVFMGGDTTPNRAVVQSAGDAIRLELRHFREEFRRVDELHRLLLLYTQSLLTQMSQTAVCNRLHSVEQQLCRWLLLSHDRLESNELVMTQELIANMLGVRREGVSVAAQRLQDEGLIRYQRGHITIVDRPGLESAVCECWPVNPYLTDTHIQRLMRAKVVKPFMADERTIDRVSTCCLPLDQSHSSAHTFRGNVASPHSLRTLPPRF